MMAPRKNKGRGRNTGEPEGNTRENQVPPRNSVAQRLVILVKGLISL